MKLLTAIDDKGVATRFAIGCEDMATEIAAALVIHHFVVILTTCDAPPERSQVERDRVSSILQLITLPEVHSTH